MEYAVVMSSGAMTYNPSFIKIGSGIQSLTWEDTQQGDPMTPLIYFFFQNKKRAVIKRFCIENGKYVAY
jgi:hypothetical protein